MKYVCFLTTNNMLSFLRLGPDREEEWVCEEKFWLGNWKESPVETEFYQLQ